MFIKHRICKTELIWQDIKKPQANIMVKAPWCPKCRIEVAIVDMTPKPKGPLSAWIPR